VSSYVSFEVFVRPALRRMIGVEPLSRPVVRARVAEPLRSPPGRRSYLRAYLSVEQGAYVVRPVGHPGSHLIASLAAANALIVVPEGVTEIAAEAAVSVVMLERRQK
jgi:molybdopterin molybdotransferase